MKNLDPIDLVIVAQESTHRVRVAMNAPGNLIKRSKGLTIIRRRIAMTHVQDGILLLLCEAVVEEAAVFTGDDILSAKVMASAICSKAWDGLVSSLLVGSLGLD